LKRGNAFGLSRIRNSFVIARNTAFTFKGKNTDTKEISKELGVRYVIALGGNEIYQLITEENEHRG
jgi:hypothetical protein